MMSGRIINIYQQDVLGIVNTYDPYKMPASWVLLNGGVAELLRYVENRA